MVDYLNFFELLASLLEMKQLKPAEMLTMFEYYLQVLNETDFVVNFIKHDGFENLEKFLPSVPASA